MTEKEKTYRYINSFDIKNSWSTILSIIVAGILLVSIIGLGIVYTIQTF